VTDPITMIIDGAPVPKARPRLGKRGNIYTPAGTASYAHTIRQLAAIEMRGRKPLRCPVMVEMLVELAIPPSWSGRRRAAAIVGDVQPASRPDLDNFIKQIDAINGVVIADDALVVELRARKRYSEHPKLVMTVYPLSAAEAVLMRSNASPRRCISAGQQFIAHGIHPDTKQPYTWHADRTLWSVPRDELPEVDEDEARSLVTHIAEMLVEKFGFQVDTGNRARTNGHAPGSPFVAHAGSVDADAELATLGREGTCGADVNDTACRVIPSLLRKGEHPADVLNRMVDAAMGMAQRVGLEWTRAEEAKATRRRILSAYANLLLKDYDPTTGAIPSWLPGDFHAQWIRSVEGGRRPVVSFNRVGFYVKRAEVHGSGAAAQANKPPAPGGPGTGQADAPRKARVVLRPFEPVDPASVPRREYLYGKHFQRRAVSATVAPGGTGKTSLVMVEAVAMATSRNLLGEQPKERCRVWLHNGEDSRDELLRRVVAVCQHYDIPQTELAGWLFLTSGTEMPLKVANGYSDLKIDAPLVEEMTRTVLEHEIDVVMLDPLVTIHSINENDNGKMDQVVRIFSRLADTCNCAVDLSQHTRKLPTGVVEHSADDARGASAVHDAVRAQRVLNVMSAKEAENLQVNEMERRSYFRVDRSKANTAPPAKVATWRKFESVALANGDDVGVVTPSVLGDAAPSEERASAAQKARDVYLPLLDRFARAGRTVGDKAGKNYAPALFAREDEAKKAKVGRAGLEEAQRQLFADQAIRVEDCGTPARPGAPDREVHMRARRTRVERASNACRTPPYTPPRAFDTPNARLRRPWRVRVGVSTARPHPRPSPTLQLKPPWSPHPGRHDPSGGQMRTLSGPGIDHLCRPTRYCICANSRWQDCNRRGIRGVRGRSA
jgi:RecA-family ATPase/Holliday junction resolvase RusA-like endonuclease